jgi:hypothetical protein
MRACRVLAAITCAAVAGSPRAALAQAPRPPQSPGDDLDRARALDQQGVRAFRDGRYGDAVRYFEEALKLGGPSSELWNVAKCQVKLDQPEAASESLERYLARTDLSADDRAGARRELDEIAHRRSTVTIASSPTGAMVAIDGKRIGRTPATSEVSAGEHTVAVQREGYPPHVERVSAHFGRAIIVDALLGPSVAPGSASAAPSPTTPRHVFTASAELAGLFARLGSLGRPVYPAALLSAAYVALDGPRIDLSAGARVTLTRLSWYDTVGAPALACGLGGEEDAPVVAVFADGALGVKASPRVRIGFDVGFGFASLPAGSLGGDAFRATCDASPGVVPAGHFGADVSYRLTPALRVVGSPLVFEVEPAWNGARSGLIDASGPALRVGFGAGFAVDL